MFFDNMEFHNVEKLIKSKDGSCYHFQRVPDNILETLNDMAKNQTSFFGTGVEIRFKMVSDEVTIKLKADEKAEAGNVHVFFGAIQGGWQYATKIIRKDETSIVIKNPYDMNEIKKIHKEYDLPFSSDVIRLILPANTCGYVGIEGEVIPPQKEDLPKKTYLAYGSSITHGSLSFTPVNSYVFRLAEMLGYDYINKGFAGSAKLEKSLAEYITSKKDWDIATLELGVNVIDDIGIEEFDRRVDEFLHVMKTDGRLVFVTDLFYSWNDFGPNHHKTVRFREIVKKYAERYLLEYTPGDTLMPDKQYLSTDLIHPSERGTHTIALNWYDIINQKISNNAKKDLNETTLIPQQSWGD